jgi:hypothetical protein
MEVHLALVQPALARIYGGEFGIWSARIKSNTSSGELHTTVIHLELTWKLEVWTSIIDV